MSDSIKLLQFLQKCSQIIGLSPLQESNGNHFGKKWTKCVFFIAETQFFAVTIGFMFTEASTIFDFGTTFFAIIGPILAVFEYFSFSWQIKNYPKFIENCDEFVEKRHRSNFKYRELNEKIELFCKGFSIGITASGVWMAISVLVFSVVNYCVLDLGPDSFYLIFPLKFPFDWQTPAGFAVAWLSEFCVGAATYLIMIQFNIILIVSCWLFISFMEDITEDMQTFNNGDVMELKRFCEIVQIHSDAKQIAIDFNGLYQYPLIGYFIWGLLSICCMFITIQFQMLDDHSQSVEILIQSLFVIGVFGMVFALCELGERVSIQFEMFGDELERCKWYEMSVEMQRMYVTLLVDTQQPVNIACYGGIQCTRETFKNLTNKAYSYFTALRKLKFPN